MSEVFIQYKGTDICLDFRCECGAECHFDGYNANAMKCPRCKTVWLLPSVLPLIKADDLDEDKHGFDEPGPAGYFYNAGYHVELDEDD
ncbi:hypothetical protein SEA_LITNINMCQUEEN_106 [Gordonia phage LitninMcQueen]